MVSPKESIVDVLNMKISEQKINELTKIALEAIAKDADHGIMQELLVDMVHRNVRLNQELQDNIEVVRKLSETDQLTQIYNRHRFVRSIEEETSRSNRYGSAISLIMFDIDHFKQVNDNFGHDVGDIVLRDLARIVEEGIRKIDVFARWGGEEFMILMPETELEDASTVAEKLRALIENHPFPKAGNITSSFGITGYVEGESFDEFTKRVDEALYESKENGRNRCTIK